MNTQSDTSQIRNFGSTPSRRTVDAVDFKRQSIVIFKLVVSLFVASITIVSPARGADPAGWESLDVLLYNTWLKPIGSQPRRFRASRIPEAIADYSAPESKAFRQLDVIVLNEAFDDYFRDSFLEAGLRRLGFAHQTEVAGHDQWFEQDSGVFIASRWPIFASEYLVYDEEICSGNDCLAEKGAVYAGITKSGVRYHVFATHLQASGGGAEQDVRESQMSELDRFVRQQAIPSDETVIIAGDLNLWRRNDHQFNSIARLLNAVQPRVVNDAKAGGYDPTAPYYTYDAPNNDNAPGDAKDYFDYVLFRREHRQPISELSFNATVPLRTDDCYTLATFKLIYSGHRASEALPRYRNEHPPCSHDLSDHHATHGRFVFEVPTPRLNIVEPQNNAITSHASTLPMRAVVDDAIEDHPDSTSYRPNRDGTYAIKWYATNAMEKRYPLPELGYNQSVEGERHEVLFDHVCHDYVAQVTAEANTRAGTISDSVAVRVAAQIVGALTIKTIPQGGDFYIEVTGDTLDVPSFKVSSRLTKTCHPEPLDTQGVSWLVTSDDGRAQAVTGGEHIVVRNAMFPRNERNVPQPLTVRAAFSLADEEVDDTVRLVPCAGRNKEVADDLALCPKEIDSACYSPWTDEECSYEIYETRRAIETARLLLLEELLSVRMADRLCPRCSSVEPIDTRVAPEMVGSLVERIQTQLIEGPVRVTAQLRELVAQLPQIQRIAVLRDVQRTIASRNPLYSMPRAESSR